MVSDIEYKGMSRVPSDQASFDGEMEEVYNLVSRNGELKPVAPPDVIGEVQGDLRFIHKTAEFEHFVVVEGNFIKAYKYNKEATIQISETAMPIVNIGQSTLHSIDAVGNTVIVITDKDIHYSLWSKDKNTYVDLSTDIPFPKITFSTSEISASTPEEYTHTFTDEDMKRDIDRIRGIKGWKIKKKKRFLGIKYGYDRQEIQNEQGTLVTTAFDNNIKGHINSGIAAMEKDKCHIFPFFIRYAIRLYDGTLIKHSQPILVTPTKFMPFHAGLVSTSKDDYRVKVQFTKPSKLNYSFNAMTELTKYEDIIEGIDVFMSDYIYTYNYDETINGFVPNPDADKGIAVLFGGIFKERDDILSDISSTSNFYKVKSFPIKELGTSKSDVLEVENIESLVNQEAMIDDFLSHDKVTARNAFSYNNKLHLSGIKRTKFKGFAYDGSTNYDTMYNADIDVGPQSFLFYPGDASEISLGSRKITLSKHEFLNGSYFLDTELNKISSSGSNAAVRKVAVVDESNKLYVSEMFNPFFFPAKSRVTLPVGEIITVSSNTKAISSGQFGQFPLYAFTDDGIWAMEVSAEGVYTARQPVSREVAINPRVLQMDSHIAFITAKGVSILSGQDTECISDIISDNNTRVHETNKNHFEIVNDFILATDSEELVPIYQTDPIQDFLKDCELAYEYINGNGRLIAVNIRYDYAYTFDLLSKTWSKIESNYTASINNYPDCYAQTRKNIYNKSYVVNLSTIPTSEEPIKVMFITRPIKLGNQLFNLRSLIHRGMFVKRGLDEDVKDGFYTAIYGSRDGISYVPVTSSSKGIMRTIGTPFRYYKYAVIASLKPDEVISGAQIDIVPKYDNRLR